MKYDGASRGNHAAYSRYLVSAMALSGAFRETDFESAPFFISAPGRSRSVIIGAEGKEIVMAARVLICFVVGIWCASLSWAIPTISDLKVTSIEPIGLAIDYNVSGVAESADNFYRSLEVSFVANNVTNIAKTLVGATNCVNGSHRVYWNMAKDGITLGESDMNVIVTYKPTSNMSPGGSDLAITTLPIEVCQETGEDGTPLTDEIGTPITFVIDHCRQGEKYYRIIWHNDAEPVVEYEAPEGALYCVIDLSGGPSTDYLSFPVTYLNEEPSGGFNTTEYKTTKLVLKRVDAGTFIMGDSIWGDSQLNTVTLTKPFYMGLFEVTQKQWELVMGSNPSFWSGDAKPVEQVSYDMIRGESDGAKWPATNSVDATSFLGKLRTKTGINFDLPTEAQWEYTCRAGTTTKYSYGDSVNGEYMLYGDNSSYSTVYEVGTNKSNPWGFYDMHGNVCEWCLDWYAVSLSGGVNPVGSSSGLYRVTRGGSWANEADVCTSSFRYVGKPSSNTHFDGFRLSISLPGYVEASTSVSVKDLHVVGSSIDGAVDLSVGKVYNGCLYDSAADLVGTIQVKAAKASVNRKTGAKTSRLSIAIQVAGEKKASLSGYLNVEEGTIVLKARDGRELYLALGANGLRGSFGEWTIDGARDVFSSKARADKSAAGDVVGMLKSRGVMTIAWGGEEGWNGLSVTVGTRGRVKVAGVLVSGAKVSVNAQMIIGEEWCVVPVVYSKKDVRLAFNIWIARDGSAAEVVGLGEDVVIGYGTNFEERAAFTLDSAAVLGLLGEGVYEEYLPDGVEITLKGSKWILPRAGRVVLKKGEIDESKLGENPAGLRLAYRTKSGTFSGSFKVYRNVEGRVKATTVSVSGVMIDGKGYGTATVKKVGSVAVRIE